jgi:hypothetical protein
MLTKEVNSLVTRPVSDKDDCVGAAPGLQHHVVDVEGGEELEPEAERPPGRLVGGVWPQALDRESLVSII